MSRANIEWSEMPSIDSNEGLEMRLLTLMEVTLAEEQEARAKEDARFRPASPAVLRRRAISELMLHAEDGFLDHLNGLVKRSAVYVASLIVLLVSAMCLGSVAGSDEFIIKHQSPIVPANIHMRNLASWKCQ